MQKKPTYSRSRPRIDRDARGESGLGLLEVLVAATIFVIGIVAVLSFFPTALKQLQVANQRTISAELAESNMAEVRVATAEALYNQQFLTSGLLRAVSSIYAAYGLYSGFSTAVSPMRGGDSTFLQRLTLSIQMPDGREETYVTYVAKQ